MNKKHGDGGVVTPRSEPVLKNHEALRDSSESSLQALWPSSMELAR